MRIKLCAALLGFLLAGSVLPARAQRIRVKLATLAPCGSVWDEALKDLKVRWQQLSNGQVRLTIYCGGTAGDELDVMRRIRIGQLHASYITTQGLESITKATRILTLPRMIRSRSELEHVFEQMGPSLESLLAERGFKVLAWSDVGFVRFFVPKSVTAIGDVRSLKMFTWAGNPETTQLWKDAEFNAVPLPATEVMTGLQTGLIEAIPTTPSIAMALQWFRHTPYMIDLIIAPLPGALIISKSRWERIPAGMRPKLEAAAQDVIARLRARDQHLEADAVRAMQKRGLKVMKPSPAEIRAWDAAADKVNRKVRGSYVAAEYFDRILRTLTSFRGRRGT